MVCLAAYTYVDVRVYAGDRIFFSFFRPSMWAQSSPHSREGLRQPRSSAVHQSPVAIYHRPACIIHLPCTHTRTHIHTQEHKPACERCEVKSEGTQYRPVSQSDIDNPYPMRPDQRPGPAAGHPLDPGPGRVNRGECAVLTRALGPRWPYSGPYSGPL